MRFTVQHCCFPETAASFRQPVRSFVRREGRLTAAQRRALTQLWPRFGVEPAGLLDLDKLFGRNAPRVLEIGFGNGETLLHLASQNPDCDYLGIEVHRPGVGHLLLELARRELDNVRVMKEDAVEILGYFLPDACLDQVLILFPDPWPKRRHHKRRMLQPGFAGLLATKLRAGGRLLLATDWESYARHMLDVMEHAGEFRNPAGAGSFAQRPAELPLTRFEYRGRRLEHAVWNLCYERR